MEAIAPQALSFELDENTGVLTAVFTPLSVATDVRATPLSLDACRQALQQDGYGAFRIDETALSALIQSVRGATSINSMVIAQRCDATFSLELSDDLMEARLTLVAPQGGKTAQSAVIDAMREQGVVYGILHSALDAALAAGVCEKLLIASGDWPQQGTACRFESLLDAAAPDALDEDHEQDQAENQREQDERFVIKKYRDLGFLLLVQPGQPLMRRTPPLPGKNGCDIQGHAVLALPIPEEPFNPSISGAVSDAADASLLVASIAGQPKLIEHGVTVNPVVEVENVDFTTGNIVFDGTLQVNGDVKSGMVLRIGGDVIVHGLVEAATIEAGGNVAVAGGIIGHAVVQGSTLSTAGLTPFANAKVVCKGSLQALFAEQAHLEAAESILIHGNTRQCTLNAGKQIIVGKGSGNKIGQIVGGHSHATHLIQAMVLGSASGVKTELQVGSDPFLGMQIATLEAAYRRKLEEVDQVLKQLTFLKHNPHKALNGIGDKVLAMRRQLLIDSKQIFEQLSALKANVLPLDQAYIKVSKAIFEGVEIRIEKHLWTASSDLGAGTLCLKNGVITLG